MYTDQTGKFLVWSSQGQQYQVVALNIDSNWSLVKTTKNRTEGELIAVIRRILERTKERDIVTKHHILENEISKAY